MTDRGGVSLLARVLFLVSCLPLGCGAPPPASPKAGATAAEPPPPPSASATPPAEPAPKSEWNSAPPEPSLVAHVDEANGAKELKAEWGKLLELARLSPKTHKSLLKNHLWKPAAECP